MTGAEYYRRYPELNYSSYLLKNQREKNISDAKFEEDHKAPVSSTSHWTITGTGSLKIIKDGESDPSEYKKCQ